MTWFPASVPCCSWVWSVWTIISWMSDWMILLCPVLELLLTYIVMCYQLMFCCGLYLFCRYVCSGNCLFAPPMAGFCYVWWNTPILLAMMIRIVYISLGASESNRCLCFVISNICQPAFLSFLFVHRNCNLYSLISLACSCIPWLYLDSNVSAVSWSGASIVISCFCSVQSAVPGSCLWAIISWILGWMILVCSALSVVVTYILMCYKLRHMFCCDMYFFWR